MEVHGAEGQILSSEFKKFALVGAGGYIAREHVESIASIGGDLVACLDPYPYNLCYLDHYFPNALYFSNPDKFSRFIASHNLDVLVVCSPNSSHFEFIKLGLENNLNVICEKPLVIRISDIDRIEKLESHSEGRVFPVMQGRYIPEFIALKEHVAKQPRKRFEVDAIYITARGPWYKSSWRGNREQSGLLPIDIGIHCIDILCFIFGEPVSFDLESVCEERMVANIEFENADARLFLSVDGKDLSQFTDNPRFFRKVNVDGSDIEFSHEFYSAHKQFYQRLIDGKGIRIGDVKSSLRLALEMSAQITVPDQNLECHIDQELSDEVRKTIQTHRFSLFSGSKVSEFEDECSKLLKVEAAVAVSSGTAALHTALVAAGIGPGDEVIVPCLTYASTAMAVLNAGAIPVFADIGLNSVAITRETVEPLLTDKTKAVIAVHLCGIPAELNSILTLCNESKILLIEDAAQAFGSTYQGCAVGTIGDFGCFSFFESKNLSTGEGGLVLAKSNDHVERARKFRHLGEAYRETNQSTTNRTQVHAESEFLSEGFNYRLSEIQAVQGLVQLKHWSELSENRYANGNRIIELFSRIPGIRPFAVPDGSRPVWNSVFFSIEGASDPDSEKRSRFIEYMRDIELPVILPYQTILPDNPVFSSFGLSGQKFLNARRQYMLHHLGFL